MLKNSIKIKQPCLILNSEARAIKQSESDLSCPIFEDEISS